MIRNAKVGPREGLGKELGTAGKKSDETPIWRTNRRFCGMNIRYFLIPSQLPRDRTVAKSHYSGRMTISIMLPWMSSWAAAWIWAGVRAFTAASYSLSKSKPKRAFVMIMDAQ